MQVNISVLTNGAIETIIINKSLLDGKENPGRCLGILSDTCLPLIWIKTTRGEVGVTPVEWHLKHEHTSGTAWSLTHSTSWVNIQSIWVFPAVSRWAYYICVCVCVLSGYCFDGDANERLKCWHCQHSLFLIFNSADSYHVHSMGMDRADGKVISDLSLAQTHS